MSIKRVLTNKSGFTLIEVLASLVILSIIILTFLNLFVFTNKTAVTNNDKLVAIHLAKATLERVKIDPFSYIDKPNATLVNNVVTETHTINDNHYEVTIHFTQTNDEKNYGLINVLVDVNKLNSNMGTTSQVEGYVSYE
ncbi:type IV pilus modification PilV family protein [Bacillus kwashiorkori]|uniref:type IV pilus modification PilV family protein n=1 Tax=Bacillus kwashiorkori TaxID=1522318 RepID=UPI000781EF1D|nr:type II secretion system protein [Bacillus kwashiorkori]